MTNLRMMLMGDSGSAKTSALWSLVEAGYTVRLCDFEAGADPLRIRAAKAPPATRARLQIKSFKDKLISIGENYSLREPLAYTSFIKAITNWKDDAGVDHKALDTWDANTILVIDTVTSLCRACMYRLQKANNKVGQRIETRDYGTIQLDIQTTLDRIVSDQIEAHVLVLCHLDYREYHEGTFAPVGMLERDISGSDPKKVSTSELEIRAVPTTFGARLSPQLGRYFNFALGAREKAVGPRKSYVIVTRDDPILPVKCPLDLPKELPNETGLATVFKAWRELGL